MRGTFDARARYSELDIVTFDKSAFIARHDDPGLCPGDGWQLLALCGKAGDKGQPRPRGEKGDKGERGEPGVTIANWILDREGYRAIPFMMDGKPGPIVELRALFEQFQSETS